MISLLKFESYYSSSISNYSLEAALTAPKQDTPWLLQISTGDYVALAAVHQYQQPVGSMSSKKLRMIDKLIPGMSVIAGRHAYDVGANKATLRNHYYTRYMSEELMIQRVFSFVNMWGYTTSILYKDIGERFFQCREILYQTRSMGKVYDSSGILAINDLDIICALAMPPELVKYQKLYYLLNGHYDPKGLVLLVKDGFDTASYKNQGLRGAYRTGIKTPITNIGVPIVTVSDVYEAVSFNPIKTINAQTINDVNNWIIGVADEVIEREKGSFTVKFG
jgi:hypothetical protein